MRFLKGIISNRIRAKDTDIPPDVRHTLNRPAEEPKSSSVRHGKGQGLGEGAHRRRSGDKG